VGARACKVRIIPLKTFFKISYKLFSQTNIGVLDNKTPQVAQECAILQVKEHRRNRALQAKQLAQQEQPDRD
jgi:hypothetical protein